MEQPHPHNLKWFEENRPEIHTFSSNIISVMFDDGKRNILVRAPVKSGKREIVECIAKMVKHKVVYITSFNRKDVKQQADEMESYGIEVIVADPKFAVVRIEHYISNNITVILCIDECDYGSGARHSMAEVTERFINDPRVVKVWISATPEEVEASAISSRDDYAFMEFQPPRQYIGAKHFIDNGLVFEPQKFFEKDADDIQLTAHAIRVLCESITPTRNIGCVRVTGRDMPVALFKSTPWKRSIERQLRACMSDGKEWEINIIDATTPFEWENRRTRAGYTLDKSMNYLFIMFQTCTRGTDLKGWHPHIAFWHDARRGASQRKDGRSNLNTLVQALLRVSHYTTMEGYGGIAQNIRVYADMNVMTYAANNDMGVYLGAGGKPPTRTRYAPKKIHNKEWKFVECNPDTFEECASSGQLGNVRDNPFSHLDPESNQYQGYIRGVWKVRTYEEVQEQNWGVDDVTKERRIVCYNDGICGIAFAKYISTTVVDEGITTVRSSMFERYG